MPGHLQFNIFHTYFSCQVRACTDSARIPDAKKTLEIVKAEPKTEPKPAVTEQKAEETPGRKKTEA